MELPTCTNTRVRSEADALKIIAGTYLGLLSPVTTCRLTAIEALATRTGCVYVWQERDKDEPVQGIGRFSDGRRWGRSCWRRGVFLMYNEQIPKGNSLFPRRDRLVKQTFSVLVNTAHGERKWRLNAYFTWGSLDSLEIIDNNPLLRNVIVDGTIFTPVRVKKSVSRGKRRTNPSAPSALADRHTSTLKTQQLNPDTIHQHSTSEHAEVRIPNNPYRVCTLYRNSLPVPWQYFTPSFNGLMSSVES